MSIIKGRIIYNAYYKSIAEMRSDKESEPGYYVSLIDGNEKTEYQITAVKSDDSIPLDNGYYATPLVFDNSSTADKKPYHSIYPVEYTVGAIEKGETVSFPDTKELVDAMFFEGWCTLSIINPYPSIQTRGERLHITSVQVRVDRAIAPIVSEVLTIGTDTYELSEEWLTGNTYTIVCSSYISNTTDIKIRVVSELGEYETSTQIKFDYPVFYDTIIANTRPSSIAILRMHKTFDKEVLLERSYMNTEYFIAVPYTRGMKELLDENNSSLLSDMTSYSVTISIGSDSVNYQCYYLPPMVGNLLKIKAVTT